MNESDVLGLVRERAGLQTFREARRALTAALGALRCVLDDTDALALAAAVPKDLARPLRRSATATVRGVDALYAETQRRERVGLGFSMEHTQVVFQVLAERLDPELVSKLRKRVPRDVAALFKRRRTFADPPPHLHEHTPHRETPIQTLSRSRPGASETLADARGELAQRASVARTSEPHADRMLASARSSRPGREDETLSKSQGRERRR
jgi:uncharacterized protein (DUF2267 family)